MRNQTSTGPAHTSPAHTSPAHTSPANTSPQRKQGIFPRSCPAPIRQGIFVSRRRRQIALSRSGLSIIEVLTAIVVALIGLAGVLVMIPFAVNQAQVGMDTEKAVHLARNAAAELEIRGTMEVSPPVVTDPVAPPAFATLPNATVRCYCFDPPGVVARAAAGNETGSFPFLHPATVNAITALSTIEGGGFDQLVLVQRASVADPATAVLAPLRNSLARSQFTWSEDLQTRVVTDQEYADPVLNPAGLNQYLSKDLVLPIQNFDQTVTTAGVVLNGRRQSLGEMSSVVLVCPSGVTPRLNLSAPAAIPNSTQCPGYPQAAPRNQLTGANDLITELRQFHMIFKRRPMPVLSGALVDRQPYDRVYQVDWPGVDLNDPSFRTTYNGGLLKLREEKVGGTASNPAIPPEVKASNDLSTQRAEIRRGDWIGLTNVHYDFGLGRFVQAWNFYRVTEASVNGDPLGPYWAVMLEGPEWDFGRQYSYDSSQVPPLFDPTYDGTTNPPTWTLPGYRFGAVQITGGGTTFDYLPTSTMAVHLPDVWTVFERTTRLGSN